MADRSLLVQVAVVLLLKKGALNEYADALISIIYDLRLREGQHRSYYKFGFQSISKLIEPQP